jgi:hypothetical protein
MEIFHLISKLPQMSYICIIISMYSLRYLMSETCVITCIMFISPISSLWTIFSCFEHMYFYFYKYAKYCMSVLAQQWILSSFGACKKHVCRSTFYTKYLLTWKCQIIKLYILSRVDVISILVTNFSLIY